jgi:hypothetical protein
MKFLDEKYKKVLQKEKTSFGLHTDVNDYVIRNEFRTKVSWHIPSQSLINLMKKFSPLVSVGAGHAYTESFAKKQGADIIATDLQPNTENGWCRGDKFYMSVEKLSARKAVLKYSERNVFMAWPPYDHPMAYQFAKAMKPGMFLIYVGESHGGCTAGDSFFNYAYKHLEQIDIKAKIDTWFGIHDHVYLYMKK